MHNLAGLWTADSHPCQSHAVDEGRDDNPSNVQTLREVLFVDYPRASGAMCLGKPLLSKYGWWWNHGRSGQVERAGLGEVIRYVRERTKLKQSCLVCGIVRSVLIVTFLCLGGIMYSFGCRINQLFHLWTFQYLECLQTWVIDVCRVVFHITTCSLADSVTARNTPFYCWTIWKTRGNPALQILQQKLKDFSLPYDIEKS